ncbi:MAG: hemolysin family protein [Halobacteriales archaeon]|nr:hemolysin family protein [Halobacteriales archaeon]
MVGVVTALRLVGGILLLLSNGFFVTTEFALTRVRQFPRKEFQEGGLKRAWEMTERLEIYLSGCQLGITVSSVGLGVVAEPAVTAVIGAALEPFGLGGGPGAGHTAGSVIVALVVINLLHVIIGEQAPTYLGIERTKTIARYGAPLLYWWTKIMGPVIIIADRIAKGLLGLVGVDITRSWTEGELEEEAPSTRSELRRQMGETLRDAGLSDDRQEEVISALEIGDQPVEEIMIDRSSIVALSTTDDIETNIKRMRNSPHVRFPLIGEDLLEFHGIVYTPAILQAIDDETLEFDPSTIDLRELATPPMTVSTTTVVSDLIDRFQTENQELALVVEEGDVVGLVTITDAVEAIIGEVEDPLDTEADETS